MTDEDPAEGIRRRRKKLKADNKDSLYVQFDADRDHLLRMSDNIRLVPSKIGDFRHRKLLRHTTRMAALVPPPKVSDFKENGEAEDADIEDEDDVEALLEEHGLLGATLEYRAPAEAIVRWIHDEYDNEHTNQDYRTALRSFGRYRLKVDEPPKSLAWIPTGTSNDFDPVPSERDLLTYDEIKSMLNECFNNRDKALIAVQFEAGLRGGELYDLRVGDVFDAEHSTGLHVDGKRGERTVHLIMSIPYLQQWLSDPEAPEHNDAPLWSKLGESERATYNTFLDYFKTPAERAGIRKQATPTNLRKSNMRWLVLMGMSQPRIEDRQGRTRGSENTARYMSRFGDESNEIAYAAIHGKEVETEEPEEHEPLTCPRCDKETPPDEDFCVWCHQALDPGTASEVEDLDRKLFNDAAAVGTEVGPDQIDATMIQRVKRELDESPALRTLLLDE